MDIRDTQIRSLHDISGEFQRIVARLDDLLFKIKALSVTIWAALSGWAITTQKYEIQLIATVALLGLWFVAATFRGAQKRFIRRSESIFGFLTDAGKLFTFDATGHVPYEVSKSLDGFEPRIERAKLLMNGLISPTVAVFYFFFIVISTLVYFVLKLESTCS